MASGSSIVKPCFPSDELFSSQSPGYLPSYSAPREPKSSTAVEIICRTISVEAADSGQEPGEMDQLKQVPNVASSYLPCKLAIFLYAPLTHLLAQNRD